MTASMRRRAGQVRARAAVRAWEYRQRNLSLGAWGRLRRLLALSARAYAVPEAEALRLLDRGHEPDPVGKEFEPPRMIIGLPADLVGGIAGAREVPVRLCPDLLAARCLVLVPFPRHET